MEIAIYKNVKYDYEVVREVTDIKESDQEFARLTEIMDVEFTPLSNVDVNSKKIALIDEDIKKAKAILETLNQKKAELLSLPAGESL